MSTTSRSSKYRKKYGRCRRELARAREEIAALQDALRRANTVDLVSSSDEDGEVDDEVDREVDDEVDREVDDEVDREVNREVDDEDEVCAICMDEINDPVVTPCNHTFCRECLVATYHSRNRKCPLCRHRLTRSDVHGADVE